MNTIKAPDSSQKDSRWGGLGLRGWSDTSGDGADDLDSAWGHSTWPAPDGTTVGAPVWGKSVGSKSRRKVFRTYLAARVALAVALVLAHLVAWWLGARATNGALTLSVVYLAHAVLSWWWVRRVSNRPAASGRQLWWLTIGADLLIFGIMHWLDPEGPLSYAALLVLPVLMSGLLMSRRRALGTAAVVALLLLLVAVWRAETLGALLLLVPQAGMAGIGFFVIVLVAGEMAARLVRQERTARSHLEMALQQVELNRLVIDEMGEGVMVVDRHCTVRAANPAARLLLAIAQTQMQPPFSLAVRSQWTALQKAVSNAFAAGHWPKGGAEIALGGREGAVRTVHVRGRFTTHPRRTPERKDQPSSAEQLGVLFMEDVRAVQARQRQERLVSMGRMSAGIAHEIRNPLAAIAQANALLHEDELPADQQRLVSIVADNVARLKRLVDDVMEAAPSASVPSRALDATAEVAAICAEWCRTVGLAPGSNSRLQVVLPGQALGVMFDPDHLHRVVVNLLDNALRHSSTKPGAMILALDPAQDAVHLWVASDGPPIAPPVEAHLFEPFHSTRSRGTGLGLYICRELCERHGASIDYLRRDGSRHANVFQVTMRSGLVDSPKRLPIHE